MDKVYSHTDYEQKIYGTWEKANAFTPDAVKTNSAKKPFTIIMPPPNANDPLHIGHAMFASLEDILIRYHRMLGDDTLWLPGTDHAGIETQFVFEKKLKKEGKSRFQFDRETLYKMIWDYVRENSNTAVNQLKRIGASADWSRLTFTLDPKIVDVVINTFQKLNNEKLIYRDMRLVNYCTHCGTAYSELEVDHKEEIAPLYYMKYGSFTIATVRPETKFRDTALAVNPKDKRYKKWLGKTLEIQGLLGPITMTVIADEEVDPKFGTGIMKVTPAHDPHDFELGQRYNLPVTPIIDFQGRMDFSWFLSQKNIDPKYRARAEKYHHKKIAEARKLMVEDLKEDGLLVKVDEKYTHNVGVCYRCGTIIEPLPLPQFFVRVAPLTKLALNALKKKQIAVLGAGHDKTLKHWLENLKDWNVSRQIVWGIRMPVWYSAKENPNTSVSFLNAQKELVSGTIHELQEKYSLEEIGVGLQSLRAPVETTYVISETSPGADYLQETDTFDTWFSSTQWPFATLHVNQPGDFQRFYPTSVMETAYDILIFWVMRMIMMGLFVTGDVPFKTIYLHGLVRDAKGQKMSKSKGNVMNPLDIIEKYGADALRMALVIRSTPGLDRSVGENDFRAMRNFTNKIWNASRFVMLMAEKNTAENPELVDDVATNNTVFEDKLRVISQTITEQLNDCRIGFAAETVYNNFWHWYCNECIEQAKTGKLSHGTLLEGLKTFLRLLHPFVPFVTEVVWQELKTANLLAEKNQSLLILENWPQAAS